MSKRYIGTTALTPIMLLAGTVFAAAGTSAPANPPAVAYTNMSVGGFAAEQSGDWGGGGFATFTMPVGQYGGLQFDGIAENNSGDWQFQGAGHVFARSPLLGLFGLYGAYNSLDGVGGFKSSRIGAEGELYLGNFTLSAVAGSRFDDTSGLFAQVKLSTYIEPDTKIYAGYIKEDRNIGMAGAEHLFANSGISIFGEARHGDDNYNAGLVGLRYYWGQDGKSLKDREREDVAPLWHHVLQKHATESIATTLAPTSTGGASTTTAAPTTTSGTTPAPTTTSGTTPAPTTTSGTTPAPTTSGTTPTPTTSGTLAPTTTVS